MTDHPIIVSAPMAKALLDGRKMQTRRLAWRAWEEERGRFVSGLTPSPWQRVRPGDRLWVREAHFLWGRWSTDGGKRAFIPEGRRVIFEPREGFMGDRRKPWKLAYWPRPSIHMPRWASRLTLLVTEVRRQRLQDITEADALAEGIVRIETPVCPLYNSGAMDREEPITALSARSCFERLWDHLHGAGAWKSNPEVVAISFTVRRRNIDAPDQAPAEAA